MIYSSTPNLASTATSCAEASHATDVIGITGPRHIAELLAEIMAADELRLAVMRCAARISASRNRNTPDRRA